MSDPEIEQAKGFEQLVGLQAFNEQIFGGGQREPGWFRRKLIREGVEARLSAIATDRPSGEPCGHVLVGTAASLGACVRGSTVGVSAPMRGRGIGRALIDFADARAHALGFEQLEFLCEGERLSWYLRQGFALIERQLALRSSGLGSRDELQTGAEPAALGRDPVWAWLPEVWTRTPASERAYLELEASHGRARIWLTREGGAWLAQRLELDGSADLSAVLGQLRRRVASGTPLLIYPCTAGTPTAEALMAADFVPVQRSFLVRRPTGKGSPFAG